MDRVGLIALLFSASGCVPIDGGAVEASWVVTTHDGRGIADCACTCPPIAKIRLQLIPVVDGSLTGGSDPCAGRTACAFSCNLQSGATRFDIPTGKYAISLVPVGADGNDITNGEVGTCSAGSPVAPIVRDVNKGRVTQLDAILMESECATDCGGSDNRKVCTK